MNFEQFMEHEDALAWQKDEYPDTAMLRRHAANRIPHKSKFTKLKPEDIPIIRAFRDRESSRHVAAIFGTSHTTILKIWQGKRWKGY